MTAVKYPLPCGCAGPKFVSMCVEHQLAEINRQQFDWNAPKNLRKRIIEADELLASEPPEGDEKARLAWCRQAAEFMRKVRGH